MRSYVPAGRRESKENFEQQRLSLQLDPGEDTDHGRNEKSSEREHFKNAVINAEHVKSIPSYGLPILFGFLLLLGYLTSLIDDSMPRVIGEDEAGFARFSEERAWRHLRSLVGGGPRVAGGRRHLHHTQLLKAELDALAANATQTVRTDWQIVTGDYYLSYRLPYINSYDRASNIIAVLEGESGFNSDGTTNSSLLLNCHYDSVPTSPGASDNALFCAVMMETLLLLSRSDHKLKHNLIFLFNGAEENALQASHGFLSHPWSRGVTGLVNLDSAGMNGKSVLFQVTDTRVLSAYRAAVPSPSAQALGEALFLSGLVPSDTDFRIFRDFGHIYGVDIAFNRYGHVYHTRYDSLELLRPGVIQHTGNVVFNFARQLADTSEFSDKMEQTDTAVYWDYLYLFMVVYSLTVANIVDALIALLGLASVLYYLWIVGLRWRHIRELLITAGTTLGSLVAGCLAVTLLTLLSVATSRQLRYYSQPWLVVPAYWTPFLLGALAASHAFDSWRADKSGLNRSLRASQAMAAGRSIWSVLVLCLLPVPVTASMRYAVTVPLLLTSLAAFVSLTVMSRWRVQGSLTWPICRTLKNVVAREGNPTCEPVPDMIKLSTSAGLVLIWCLAWQRLLMEVALSVPSLLFVFSLALKMDALMLPTMGRSLTAYPDYIVAIINVVLVILCCLPLAGIELLFSRRRMWLVGSVLGLVSLILMFLPLTVYNVDSEYPAPQRYNIFHTQRRWQERVGGVTVASLDSGVWAGHTDVNSPRTLIEHAGSARASGDFAADCERYLYCRLPTVTPRTADSVPFSVWMDFPPPAPFNPVPSVDLVEKACSEGLCTLNFTLTGTAHTSLAMWPREGVKLLGWSFQSAVANITAKAGRPVYYVFHATCTHQDVFVPFPFALQLEVAEGLDPSTDPLLDVVFNAHKTHHEDELTPEFSAFIASLPEWFNVVPYITMLIEYIF